MSGPTPTRPTSLKELQEREARQMGPDVLVVYDTNLSEEREVTTEEGEMKKKSLLGKATTSWKTAETNKTSLKGDDVV